MEYAMCPSLIASAQPHVLSESWLLTFSPQRHVPCPKQSKTAPVSPCENKGLLPSQRSQGFERGHSFAQPIQVVHIVLQQAVAVAGCHRHGVRGQGQAFIPIADGKGRAQQVRVGDSLAGNAWLGGCLRRACLLEASTLRIAGCFAA